MWPETAAVSLRGRCHCTEFERCVCCLSVWMECVVCVVVAVAVWVAAAAAVFFRGRRYGTELARCVSFALLLSHRDEGPPKH